MAQNSDNALPPSSEETLAKTQTQSESNAEKGVLENVKNVETGDSVPVRTAFYDKEGFRTYGDGFDHDHEPPWTIKRAMSFVAMAILWTGSQSPVYLFGAVPPYIYKEIGGADRWTWFVLANLLALAAVCPFVGSLSDLVGRRYVALLGAAFLVLGNVVCSVASTMNIFIGGMALSGVGAGIGELTALAATAEMAPTSKRGKYVAFLVLTIIPFCPSVLWAQLMAGYGDWRWIGLFNGVWVFLGLIITAVYYFPPPRINSKGLSKTDILVRIDYLGGLLSLGGLILFTLGLQWGGHLYPWRSVHVITTFILGNILLVAFCIWEWKLAPFPMFPKRIIQNPRVLLLTIVITLISGANFFSMLMFWPTQAYNVYGHDPIDIGVRGLPIGFAILAGAFIVLWLLSVLKGYIRALLVVSSVLMTVGCGSLAAARVDNMELLWLLLIIGGLGIGGIVVPASIITTIICPDDLIATVTALTLTIRVVGGSVGFASYHAIFVDKFGPAAARIIGNETLVTRFNITNATVIQKAIELTGASMIEEIKLIPGIANNTEIWEAVVLAGQMAYAEAYKWVYYLSIAFGVISIVAACFLGDIKQYMDDHVAVII